ncbi:hypothetical protein CRU94_02370 [Arcobacter sp. AHV-9/2010]|uniref:hypothetical protein n=1 Tax=Arcobacter sp. AHV-9/2010 TaxID=2021861 RepID=UPI00100AB9F0|nr:hypothetical protein [Arcobacter sp. CECT 9299]RXJ96981.1 hypothetical protein CRU94_02370 [Arcobacter sp. CECT 9299]
MKKRNYWPLFFIGIFSFTLIMIVWTISKAVQAPVIDDKSFINKYQYVDENYNSIMESNMRFLNKYTLNFDLNGTIFPLTTDDIKFGQRVLEKFSNHKNILKIGENSLKVEIFDNKSNEKKVANIDLLVTKTMSDESDIELKNDNFKETNRVYETNFNLKEEANWIITGKFEVENEIGYILIKTNAR